MQISHRIILVTGLLGLVAAGLYPPWHYDGVSVGYSPLWAPIDGFVLIDWDRLMLTWVLIVASTVIVLLMGDFVISAIRKSAVLSVWHLAFRQRMTDLGLIGWLSAAVAVCLVALALYAAKQRDDKLRAFTAEAQIRQLHRR